MEKEKCEYVKTCVYYSVDSVTCNETAGDYYGRNRQGGCYRLHVHDQLDWYTKLVSYALDNDIPVRICKYPDEPYQNMLGLDIGNVVFGPMAWEMFEDQIDKDDLSKVAQVIADTQLKIKQRKSAGQHES